MSAVLLSWIGSRGRGTGSCHALTLFYSSRVPWLCRKVLRCLIWYDSSLLSVRSSPTSTAAARSLKPLLRRLSAAMRRSPPLSASTTRLIPRPLRLIRLVRPKRKPAPLSDRVLETLVSSGPKTRQELRALHCPPANENTLDSALSRLKARGAVRKEGDLLVLVDSSTLPPTSRSPSGAGAAVDQRGQQPVAGPVAQSVSEPAGSTSPSSAD